jgi:hypothetical protein
MRTKSLEGAMKKKKTYLKKASKHWHINLVAPLSNYLNCKTRPRKQGTQDVLVNEIDTTMVVRMLDMQECGLPITLQQLKIKVEKLTQTQLDSKMEFFKTNGGISSSVNIQN